MRHRLLIRNLVASLLSCFLGACVQAEGTNPMNVAATESHVVLVRDPKAMNSFTADAHKVRAMVAAGINALTGERDEASAWRHFANSNDVIGIKINTQAGPLQSTRRAVVEAIAQGLRAAGVNATNIYVFDRDPIQMRAAGYLKTSTTNQMQEVSIIDGTDWEPLAYFQDNLAGKLIWGDLLFGKVVDQDLSKRSHLPKLVTGTITKLINGPVLQNHEVCGLAGCLYNLSLGMVDNTRRFETVGQHGDPMIAEICNMPVLHGKPVLNVMDGLIAGYAGGLGFKPRYSWNCGALYFSTDPVAIDSLCIDVLEAKGREAKVPLIRPLATHVATANRLGLGQSNPAKIDLSEVKP
jgi:uncharacterized protein (DUF362 family)